MKTFRELKIVDPLQKKSKLLSVLDYMKSYPEQKWLYRDDLSNDYAKNVSKEIREVGCFESNFENYEKALIWVILWGREIKVSNIIPVNKRKLSFDQYNILIENFYSDMINLISLKFEVDVIISPPEKDLREIIGINTYNKLIKWARTCNRDTGNLHPRDFELWASFLTTVFDQESSLTPSLLGRILKEEMDWQEDETLQKLLIDFEYGLDLLKFYAKHRI